MNTKSQFDSLRVLLTEYPPVKERMQAVGVDNHANEQFGVLAVAYALAFRTHQNAQTARSIEDEIKLLGSAYELLGQAVWYFIETTADSPVEFMRAIEGVIRKMNEDIQNAASVLANTPEES